MNQTYNTVGAGVIAWVCIGLCLWFGAAAISQKEQKGSNRWGG